MENFGILLGFFILILKEAVVKASEIELISMKTLPLEDPTFMNYGNLRLTRIGRNHFVISGELEFLQTFGDEIYGVMEFYDAQGRQLMKSQKKACEYMRTDKIMYPEVLKKSNLPEHCPFPKGKYTIKDYEFKAGSNLPLPEGKYTLKSYPAKDGKMKGGWVMDFLIKK